MNKKYSGARHRTFVALKDKGAWAGRGPLYPTAAAAYAGFDCLQWNVFSLSSV